MGLTKYPSGSVRELWSVSFPLMLSSLSMMLMIFSDRLMLTYYNADAMAATVTAGTAAWAILGSLLILAGMSEVFVAQYNGAKRYTEVGKPVWQMIWFALASLVVLIPLSIWGSQYFFLSSPHPEMEAVYFRWLTGVGIVFPLNGALSAFFVGRGKTQLVMWLAVLANAVNILFDWLLIYGVGDWIPPLGIQGAAMASCLGSLIQVIVLAAIFLKKSHRKQYGTGLLNFDKKLIRKVLRIGIPQGGLFFVELVGWAIFYMMIAHQGPEHIFVAGICQTVIILFMFIAEGVGRGAAAISGNLIGENNHASAFAVFRSGLKIHLVFFFIVAIFFVVFPQLVINLFVNDTVLRLQDWGRQITQADLDTMIGTLRISLQISMFYLLFEAVRWLVSGILSAAGDTMFLLVVGVVTVPLTQLLPAYYLIEKMGAGVIVAFCIAVEYALVVSTIFLWRFFGRKWQQINLLSE